MNPQDDIPASDQQAALSEDARGPSKEHIESVIEAILFASDEPIPVSRIASITDLTASQVNAAVEALNQRYQANGHAFRIERIAGGLQFLTLPQYNVYLRRLARVREDHKLSPAALETLAIIAYKQPVIRAQIEAIRGVSCGEIIKSLMAKGLVKIVGRAEVIGRPLQYGTTKRFLEVFGLNCLDDLPKITELKQPDTGS